MIPLKIDQGQIARAVIDHPDFNNRRDHLTIFINDYIEVKVAWCANIKFIRAVTAVEFIDTILTARHKDQFVLLGNWPAPANHADAL